MSVKISVRMLILLPKKLKNDIFAEFLELNLLLKFLILASKKMLKKRFKFNSTQKISRKNDTKVITLLAKSILRKHELKIAIFVFLP